MLKIINLILVITILITAMLLIRQRFIARQYYIMLNQLQNQAISLDEEYSRLRLEEGTYSSSLVVTNFIASRLSLIQPDSAHIVDIKNDSQSTQ